MSVSFCPFDDENIQSNLSAPSSHTLDYHSPLATNHSSAGRYTAQCGGTAATDPR